MTGAGAHNKIRNVIHGALSPKRACALRAFERMIHIQVLERFQPRCIVRSGGLAANQMPGRFGLKREVAVVASETKVRCVIVLGNIQNMRIESGGRDAEPGTTKTGS